MKYYCNKDDGLKLGTKHYRIDEEIPNGGSYPDLIRWEWIRTEGTADPLVISGKAKQVRSTIHGKTSKKDKGYRSRRQKNT